MTDHDALLAAILADPKEDTPRLVYADWLDENARAVECGRCGGSGEADPKHFVTYSPSQKRVLYERPDDAKCPACSGTGRVSDGRRERAEFIRVQVEIARIRPEADPKKGVIINPRTGGLDYATPPAFARWQELDRRERELQIAACPAWRHEQFSSELAEEMNAPLVGGMLFSGAVNVFYTRGFVSSLTCSWDSWRTHAAAIIACQPVECVTITDEIGSEEMRELERWEAVKFDIRLQEAAV